MVAVQRKLTSSFWKEQPQGPAAQYLGVLLVLLDELDRDAFAEEINRLLAGEIHPLHRRTVDLLARRRGDKPAFSIGNNLPVYIAPDLESQAGVLLGNIDKWSRTPHLVLDGIVRIDIIADHPEIDYRGLYDLYYSGITLTWPTDNLRGLSLWLRRIRAEFTFYHEVGHHVCGHTEGGSVPDQEEEADKYARMMIRQAHPVLSGAVRTLTLPITITRAMFRRRKIA